MSSSLCKKEYKTMAAEHAVKFTENVLKNIIQTTNS